MNLSQYPISFDQLTDEDAMNIVGASDQNLATIANFFDVQLVFRDATFSVVDADKDTIQMIEKTLETLYQLSKKNIEIRQQDVIYACRMAKQDKDIDVEKFQAKVIGRTVSGKAIIPKTQGQYDFACALESKPIVFAIGPAGTGKTYLAVVNAVSALKKGDVKRIVLTRPAVEAGENLGFLPGDLKEKVDPYLTPLYDALHLTLGREQTEKLIEKGVVEIAPLAYMRGRTLDDSYVILDEAQNTTTSQMKMFLTRLGFRSKMVVTGDITQIDLSHHVESGLVQAAKLLKPIHEIAMITLSSDDVVRHPLVQKIIEQYEKGI